MERARYAFEMGSVDCREIAKLIATGKASQQAKSGERSVWLVSYKGQTLRVVYNEVYRAVETVLLIEPPDFTPDPTAEFSSQVREAKKTRRMR